MKLLLDENLPHEIRLYLPGHTVHTVAYMGWAGLRNGELLSRAAQDAFEALITLDLGIAYQRNPLALPMSVLIVRALSNRIDALVPWVPKVLDALTRIQPKQLLVLT